MSFQVIDRQLFAQLILKVFWCSALGDQGQAFHKRSDGPTKRLTWSDGAPICQSKLSDQVVEGELAILIAKEDKGLNLLNVSADICSLTLDSFKWQTLKRVVWLLLTQFWLLPEHDKMLFSRYVVAKSAWFYFSTKRGASSFSLSCRSLCKQKQHARFAHHLPAISHSLSRYTWTFASHFCRDI